MNKKLTAIAILCPTVALAQSQSITNALPNSSASVSISNLNATGIPGSNTYLRGDGTWSTPGGSGVPGGTSGQVQYNNAGAFGGFTVGGDGTLNTGTGALTVNKVNGAAIPTSAAALSSNASNQITAAPVTGSGPIVLSTSPSLTTPNIGAATASGLTLSSVTGAIQCLQANASGVVSGTGAACGSGGGGGGITAGSTTTSGFSAKTLVGSNGSTATQVTADPSTMTVSGNTLYAPGLSMPPLRSGYYYHPTVPGAYVNNGASYQTALFIALPIYVAPGSANLGSIGYFGGTAPTTAYSWEACLFADNMQEGRHQPGTLLYDTGAQTSGTVANTFISVTANYAWPSPGWYWIVMRYNTGGAGGTITVIGNYSNATWDPWSTYNGISSASGSANAGNGVYVRFGISGSAPPSFGSCGTVGTTTFTGNGYLATGAYGTVLDFPSAPVTPSFLIQGQ